MKYSSFVRKHMPPPPPSFPHLELWSVPRTDEALVGANRLVGPARRLQGVLCVETSPAHFTVIPEVLRLVGVHILHLRPPAPGPRWHRQTREGRGEVGVHVCRLLCVCCCCCESVGCHGASIGSSVLGLSSVLRG